jgi:hypothetical protein
LDTELTAMASESYQRAYNTMVIVQMLAELEEVIQFKVVPERREDIKIMWWERLKVRIMKYFLFKDNYFSNIYVFVNCYRVVLIELKIGRKFCKLDQ